MVLGRFIFLGLWTRLKRFFCEISPDDTEVKRNLDAALRGAEKIVGASNISECVRKLRQTQELLQAACQVSAEALGCLSKPKVKDLPSESQQKALKYAKLCVRECAFWCCIAKVVGLDSNPAVLRCFPEARIRAGQDEDSIVSQLSNAYRKHSSPLASEIGRKPRIASSTERRVQNGRQSPNQAGLQALTPSGKILVVDVVDVAGVGCASVAPSACAVPQPSFSGIDTMAPCASDPVLAHLAEPTDHHQLYISGFSHDGSKQQCRRSPGPRSRDSVSNQQMAQMLDMMKVLTPAI